MLSFFRSKAKQGGFCLGNWRVFPQKDCIINRDQQEKHIEPKVMQVLVLLVKNYGSVVTREELFKHIWGNHHVVDESLTRTIYQLRKALGDDSHHPEYIKTIPKIGYELLVQPSDHSNATSPIWLNEKLFRVVTLIALVSVIVTATIISSIALFGCFSSG